MTIDGSLCSEFDPPWVPHNDDPMPEQVKLRQTVNAQTQF